MRKRIVALPLILALVLTTTNSIKPVMMDDTAYLRFAQQIAEHPTDPYGFSWGWYSDDQPAFEILAPPVLLYYLAIGMTVIGHEPWQLKLAMFPVAWLFTYALSQLLRRFCRRVDQPLLIIASLSPWVWPAWNLMLDLPAMALMLAGLHLAFCALDRKRWATAFASALLIALAIQTKYTAFVAPAVVIGYGVFQRSRLMGVTIALIAGLGFALIEGLIALRYGQSHFLYHLRHPMIWQGQAVTGLRQKVEMIPPLLAQFGGLGPGLFVLTLFALGFGRGVRRAAVAFTIASVLIVGIIGGESILCPLSAVAVTTGCLGVIVVLLRRTHRSRIDLFLIMWWTWELTAMIYLSPFPAARRGIGLSLVSIFVIGRCARYRRHSPEWIEVVAFGVLFAAFITWIDRIDAHAEPVAVRGTIDDIRAIDPKARIWFLGRWGFQYEAERAGLLRLDAGRSVLEAGDYLLVPELRPVRPMVPLDADALQWQWRKEWTWPILYRTIGEYYAGRIPYAHHQGPQIRVDVYRLIHQWKPQGFAR